MRNTLHPGYIKLNIPFLEIFCVIGMTPDKRVAPWGYLTLYWSTICKDSSAFYVSFKCISSSSAQRMLASSFKPSNLFLKRSAPSFSKSVIGHHVIMLGALQFFWDVFFCFARKLEFQILFAITYFRICVFFFWSSHLAFFFSQFPCSRFYLFFH